MNELAAAAPWIIVAAVSLLVGAALGYYTAARDLDEVREKARAEGVLEGITQAYRAMGRRR